MNLQEQNKRLEDEIKQQQQTIAYDTKEYTIEYIVDKYLKKLESDSNEFFVPDYQREFVWDIYRQSRFIESLIIGLPIPLIFLAETNDGRYEIVDGSQRIRTLSAFLSDELEINKLELLSPLNGFRFSQLDTSRQRKFKNISLKMIVLSDQTSSKAKNDIFERINRGSDLLKDMEKRKGIFRGPFNDFIYEMAKNKVFQEITPIASWFENRQEREELILRYFAFSDIYPNFKEKMGIARQLDEYMQNENRHFESNTLRKKEKKENFERMISIVKSYLPHGFSKNGNHQVSRVYFEAISVGIILAIKECPNISFSTHKLKQIVNSNEFKNIISGKYHTHTKERICQRIEYVRNRILENR